MARFTQNKSLTLPCRLPIGARHRGATTVRGGARLTDPTRQGMSLATRLGKLLEPKATTDTVLRYALATVARRFLKACRLRGLTVPDSLTKPIPETRPRRGKPKCYKAKR